MSRTKASFSAAFLDPVGKKEHLPDPGPWQQSGRALTRQPSGPESLMGSDKAPPFCHRAQQVQLQGQGACPLVSSGCRETASGPLVYGAIQI